MLIQLGIEPSEAILSSPAETQLATRALLERQAAEQPLVLVVDDLHWAEPPMLDLVEHVADWSRSAPILLLCLARPELLDVRPGWAGGKLNATSVLLEPLADGEASTSSPTSYSPVSSSTTRRGHASSTTADGNPLFLEEMAALARDARGAVDVPPTIQALLQARLDTLNHDERIVIERGSVEGQVFHRGAVTALAPARSERRRAPAARRARSEGARAARAGRHRRRRRLPLPTPSDPRHGLRRAAEGSAGGAPRALRRLARRNTQLVEQDEIVGYHLEQAARYRIELDADDPAAGVLARRAAEKLGSAGHATLERGDVHATQNLLGRALALAEDPAGRRRLIPDLADAMIDGRAPSGEVVALLDELDGGDARDRALATVLRIRHEFTGPLEELLALLADAEEALTAAGDTLGLVRCESARAWSYFGACHMAEAHRAYLRAYEHHRRAGSQVLLRDVLFGIGITGVFSGLAVDDFLALLDRMDDQAIAAGPLLAATLRSFRMRVEYGAGRGGLDELRSTTNAELELLEQTGIGTRGAVQTFVRVVVPWLDGDGVAVEAGARQRVEEEKASGTNLFYANAIAMWAETLCQLGEAERALELVNHAREIADPNDVADQIDLDLAEAHARALAGEAGLALKLLERARETARGTDIRTPVFGHDYVEACVFKALGDSEAARAALERVIERETRLGFHRFADRFRRDLAALEARAPD